MCAAAFTGRIEVQVVSPRRLQALAQARRGFGMGDAETDDEARHKFAHFARRDRDIAPRQFGDRFLGRATAPEHLFADEDHDVVAERAVRAHQGGQFGAAEHRRVGTAVAVEYGLMGDEPAQVQRGRTPGLRLPDLQPGAAVRTALELAAKMQLRHDREQRRR